MVKRAAAAAKAGSQAKKAPPVHTPTKKEVAAKKAAGKSQKATSLVDKLDIEENATPDKSHGGRTEEQNVIKICDEKFPGFSFEEIFVYEVDGLTCHDRIKMNRLDGTTMGKYYYQDLRKMYRDPEAKINKLQVKNKTQVKDDALEEALVALMDTKRSTEQIKMWSLAVDSVNQRNIVALFKILLQIAPGRNLENAMVMAHIMGMIVRLDLASQHQYECGLMFDHWDAAASKSLRSFKSQKQTGKQWWDAHKSWAQAITPLRAADRALAEEKEFSRVKDDIAAVTSAGSTGELLLGGARKQIRLDHVTAFVSEQLAAFDVSNVTRTSMAMAAARFGEKAREEGVDPFEKFLEKEVKVVYRRRFVAVRVTSVMDHFKTALEAKVRGLAVDLKVLDAMWVEDDLVEPVGGEGAKGSIAADVLALAKSTRQAVTDALEVDEATPETVKKVLVEKDKWLTSNDTYWKIHKSFWLSFTGDEAKRRTETLAKDCLAQAVEGNDSTDKKLLRAKELLENLQKAKIVTFSGVACTRVVTIVLGHVKTLLQGHEPELKTNNNAFLVSVKNALETFCVHEAPAGAAAANRTQGREAAKALLAELGGQAKVTAEGFGKVVRWGWLFSPAEKNTLKNIKKKVHARKAQDSGSAEGPEKKASKKDTRAIVKGMFD